jgi:hypothetical protein
MRRTDETRFKACLMACAEVYGKPVSAAVTGIWWDALKTYDIGAVEDAFRRHLYSPDIGQYMPKPADILRMLEGTAVDGAMVAWAKVDRAVRTVGPYPSVTFDDPLIQRIVQEMGGWIALCGKRSDEWPFIGNEFRTRYHGYSSRAALPEYPGRLPGMIEADHGGAYRGQNDVLIGDGEKALAVRTGGVVTPLLGVRRITAALVNRGS